MADEDVLIHADDRGSWGWAGSLLVPARASGPVNHYADFDRDRQEERAADAGTAWLSAQWGVHWSAQWGPDGAGRFEIRYRNDPEAGDGLLRCACLCRIRGGTVRGAVDQARAYRGSLASGLPGHVRAEPLTRAEDVHGWLVPFDEPGPGNSQTEIIKRLTWRQTLRPDADRTVTLLVARLSGRRVPWEPMLRRLATLPFPAVLSVGIEPFQRSAAFRLGLQTLADQYAALARPAANPPPQSTPEPPDHFAAQAAQRYAHYVRQHASPAFRIRISLAGARELPEHLGGWLLTALGDGGPESGGSAASALRPLPDERDTAWTNLTTLSAAWLTDTFRGRLPEVVLGPVERDLMVLVDLAEARSLIQLPISWPGEPELFAGAE